MGIENPVHLLFIAAVALVVLGPKRLPELARSLGKGIREFRESLNEGSITGATHVPAPAPAPASTPQDATVVGRPEDFVAPPETVVVPPEVVVAPAQGAHANAEAPDGKAP